MCGPSSQEQNIASSQQSAGQTFQQWANQRFQGQTDLLNKMNTTYDATLALGPQGLGMPTQERRTLESQAINRSAANYANTSRAVLGQTSGRGGDTGLMTGTEAKIRAGLASDAASQLSNEQANIGLQDAQLGQQRYQSALAGKQALLSSYDPAQFGQLGNSANSSAFDMSKTIQSQRGGFWKTLGGIASAGIQAGLGALTGGASMAVTPGLFNAVTQSAGQSGQNVAAGIDTMMDPGGDLIPPQ
jgi:hypothetical protein